MHIVTTQTIAGMTISEVKGAIFTEQVIAVNAVKDTLSGIKGIFGGRSATYSEEYSKGRELALENSQRKRGACQRTQYSRQELAILSSLIPTSCCWSLRQAAQRRSWRKPLHSPQRRKTYEYNNLNVQALSVDGSCPRRGAGSGVADRIFQQVLPHRYRKSAARVKCDALTVRCIQCHDLPEWLCFRNPLSGSVEAIPCFCRQISHR
jgi:hypothetical protein